MILISVDLPAPFSPSSAWISPACRVSETSSSAWVEPKRLLTPRISRIGGGSAASRTVVVAAASGAPARCLVHPTPTHARRPARQRSRRSVRTSARRRVPTATMSSDADERRSRDRRGAGAGGPRRVRMDSIDEHERAESSPRASGPRPGCRSGRPGSRTRNRCVTTTDRHEQPRDVRARHVAGREQGDAHDGGQRGPDDIRLDDPDARVGDEPCHDGEQARAGGGAHDPPRPSPAIEPGEGVGAARTGRPRPR